MSHACPLKRDQFNLWSFQPTCLRGCVSFQGKLLINIDPWKVAWKPLVFSQPSLIAVKKGWSYSHSQSLFCTAATSTDSAVQSKHKACEWLDPTDQFTPVKSNMEPENVGCFLVGCFLGSMLNFRGVPSLKLSANAAWKWMDGWNTFAFPFRISADFRGASSVGFRECKS